MVFVGTSVFLPTEVLDVESDLRQSLERLGKFSEKTKERTINNWRRLLPSREISSGYCRCAGPGEKYQKDSD